MYSTLHLYALQTVDHIDHTTERPRGPEIIIMGGPTNADSINCERRREAKRARAWRRFRECRTRDHHTQWNGVGAQVRRARTRACVTRMNENAAAEAAAIHPRSILAYAPLEKLEFA